MRRFVLCLVLLVLAFTGSALIAQDTASITGLVTDSSGALVSDTQITLANPATGVSYQATSNASGSYTISQVPAGPGYKITFAHDGFQPTVVLDMYLNVATTRTQNAKLLVSGVAQTLEVSAGSQTVTINTTDASIGNNYDVKMVNSLPVQSRDTPAALFVLQPGVTLDGAVTGARVDQNNITLDGMDVNDFATGGTSGTGTTGFIMVGKAPVDAVQEFRGTVAGQPVNSGPSGGGQYQLVTKSGTNQFHGNLNEYHRDTSTTANDWFNNNAGVNRPALIRNQFGGNIGGPVLKDKLFVFFNYYNSRIIKSAQEIRTVPLDGLRNGNVSYIRSDGTVGTLTLQQMQGLDPQGAGVDTSMLSSLAQRYPHANDVTAGDGINTGGFRFNAPDNDFLTIYVGRVDYNLNSKMKAFGRFNLVRENGVETPNQFPGDPATGPYIDRSYSYVFGHTWQIGSNKVNQFYYGDTVGQPSFPNTYNPQGNNPLIFSGGTTSFLSPAYASPANAQGRSISIPVVGDDFNWQKGNHNLQFGGTFKFITSQSYDKLDYNTYSIGLGGNTLSLNPTLRPTNILSAGSQGSTAASVYDSAFTFALGHVANITSAWNYDNKGNALAQGTGENRKYRYYQTQVYLGDTWKVTPNLTLSYGVNYQFFSVPYEMNGLESFQPLTFDQYFSARIAASAAGKTGYDAVPLIAYVLGGKANHGPALYQPSYKDIAPRFAFAFNPGFDNKTVFNGGAGIVYDRTIINAVQYQQDQHSYLFQQQIGTPFGTSGDATGSLAGDPRVGANYALPGVTAPPAVTAPFQPFVSGGVADGLINGDVSIGNTIIDPTFKTPYSIAFNAGFQHEFPGNFVLKMSYVGRLGRRLLGQADANQVLDFADPTSQQLLSAALGNVAQDLRAGGDPTHLQSQGWFENMVPPGLGASQTYTDSKGVKHHFPNNTSFLAYNLESLMFNGDFADFVQALASNGLIDPGVGMSPQFANNTYYTNKGFSSYNGLLMTLQKNLSHGLQFDFNYTWSHSIDNVSLIANDSAGGEGYGFICNALQPRACRGNSDFDVTNNITADFTYSLPFGRGRTFGATIPFLLNELVGGWDLSGISQYHSGIAYGTVSNAFVAGFANDAPAIFNGDFSAISGHAHKTSDGSVNIFTDHTAASSAFSGPIGFTIGTRNSLRGPGFYNQNLGLAKTFPLRDWLSLKFRADAYNVFNHPNFSLPKFDPANNLFQTDITNSTFGRITSVDINSAARVMQFALRLEF